MESNLTHEQADDNFSFVARFGNEMALSLAGVNKSV